MRENGAATGNRTPDFPVTGGRSYYYSIAAKQGGRPEPLDDRGFRPRLGSNQRFPQDGQSGGICTHIISLPRRVAELLGTTL